MTTDQIWLQITSGRGPVECQLAVMHLANHVLGEAEAQGLTANLIECVEGDCRGGARSALLSLGGQGAKLYAERNAGTVLWTCRSPLRPQHKRKNWFVGVDILTPPDRESRIIRPEDVVFEAMRASGPGGQHVNKTESAVRATHKPTGLVATAREERSQAMNKKLALARLADMAARATARDKADADRDRWREHDALERGKPTRAFEGPDFREA